MNAHELATAIGLKPRVLYGWNRMGYLHPAHIRAENGGVTPSKACAYSPAEIAVATRMAAMVKAGLTQQAAHAVARGDVAAATAIVTAVEDTTLDPVLEPMRPDEAVADRAKWDAMDLTVAVRDVDPRDLWRELEAMCGDEPRRLMAAVVALAAMVPVETPVSKLLAWTESLQVDQEVA